MFSTVIWQRITHKNRLEQVLVYEFIIIDKMIKLIKQTIVPLPSTIDYLLSSLSKKLYAN